VTVTQSFLSNKDFVAVGDSKTNIGSLAANEIDNDKDLMNFIVEV